MIGVIAVTKQVSKTGHGRGPVNCSYISRWTCFGCCSACQQSYHQDDRSSGSCLVILQGSIAAELDSTCLMLGTSILWVRRFAFMGFLPKELHPLGQSD